jgi:hypothetical protein
MFTLEGKRTTLRKKWVVVGFASAFLACGVMWMMGGRQTDGAGAQSARLPASKEAASVNKVSRSNEFSRSNEAAVLSAQPASAPPLTPHGSSSLGRPEKLPLQKTTEKAKAPSNEGSMRSAVVESVSRSTITLKDHVLAPRAVQEKVNSKLKRQRNSEQAKEMSLLEAGIRSVEGAGTAPDKKKRLNAGSRLGLPPLADMEKECRRASLLDSMPPSYCSCDVGEFEQMECSVSASVAQSVANN